MLNNTITTARSVMAQATLPIQLGPDYQCFTCGAPAQGLQVWSELPHGRGYSPLDSWGDHIAYLILPGCPSAHMPRVAKLGDCITPLTFEDQHMTQCRWAEAQQHNITAIRDALAALAAAVPEDERHNDPATRLVCDLIAGRIAPAAAIAQMRLWGG